jgi:hypothetical protein
MALPKLPCEYKELGKKRTKDCFGDLPIESKKHLIKCFEETNKKLDAIKYLKN